MKANILMMKNDIKALVETQIQTKAQRKTVTYTLPRTMSPSQATYNAETQRDELTTYYQAYATLRGKDPKVHGDIKLSNLYAILLLTYDYKDEETVCDN